MTHASLRANEAQTPEDLPVFVRPGATEPTFLTEAAGALRDLARRPAARPTRRGLLAAAVLVPLAWGVGVTLTPTPEARASEAPAAEQPAGAFQAALDASKAGAPEPRPEPAAFPAGRHTVAAGESWAELAERFHVSAKTLAGVNDASPDTAPKAGTELLIPPTDGVLHPLASGETLLALCSRYEVTLKALQAANPGLRSDRLQIGQRIFVPGAKAMKPAPVQLSRGASREGTIRTASRGLMGAASRIGHFLHPTMGGGYLSSGFGYRGSHFHSGLDICNPFGTRIHAARAGVVIAAGWNGAYGNAVDIDHGGGVVTRYGHCSKLLCQPGQTVEAGEVIALVGSTGRSTANHVHFEVRVNGRAMDPTPFL